MATLNFKFLSDLSGLNKGIGKGSKALRGFESTTKKISSGIGKALGGIGLTLGAGALVGQLTQAAKAAAEDAAQQRLLALQLKTTTNATDDQIASAESFIDKLSRATGELDDNLRPALSNAVRATGSLTEGQELLEIALDGARASGKPLDSVLQALLKANNGNTTALYKLAPQLKKTKGGIDDYAKSVKGAAEESADPFAKMNVAMENVEERLGTALLPIFEKFANFVIDVAAPAIEDFIKQASDPSTETGATFKRIGDIIGEIWELIQKIGKSESFKKVLEGTLTVAETLLDVIENIANLLGTNAEAEKTKGNALSFTKSGKASVLSDANIQASANQLGYTLKPFQIARARADLSGGADGNPMTPWPMAKGGVVLPRPGGTIARIGEAGRPEAVIPLDKFGALGGNTYVININKANVTGNEIVAAIQRYERGTGRRYLANG